MAQGAGVSPSILLRAWASLALLAAFSLFTKGLEFPCRFPSTVATTVSTAATAFTALGFGDIDLDVAAFHFGVVEGGHNGVALILLSDEHETKALGLASRSGSEDDFVNRSVSSDHLLELVLRCGERQVPDVEFETLGLLSFLSSTFLLVVISVSNTDAATVDSVAVKGLDGGLGHGFLGVGDKAEASVHTGVIGQHNTIGHVAVGLEQFTEFIGANISGQAAHEESGAGGSSLASAATASTTLAFKAEVGALSSVFTNIGGDEGGSAGRAFGEHGFSSSAPALARIVQSARPLVEFGPASAEVVGQGSVGLIATGGALDVPIAIEFGLKGITARWANGVEHTAIVSLAEIEANDRLNFLHDGTADVSSA